MPRRDQGTRWNSWYEMIDQVLQDIKPQILQLLAEELLLKDDTLTSGRMADIGVYTSFLSRLLWCDQSNRGPESNTRKSNPIAWFSLYTNLTKQLRGTDIIHICIDAFRLDIQSFWSTGIWMIALLYTQLQLSLIPFRNMTTSVITGTLRGNQSWSQLCNHYGRIRIKVIIQFLRSWPHRIQLYILQLRIHSSIGSNSDGLR